MDCGLPSKKGEEAWQASNTPAFKLILQTSADGLGFCANSLELGCDCVGNIQYFDAVMNDSKGGPPPLHPLPRGSKTPGPPSQREGQGVWEEGTVNSLDLILI